MKDIIPINVFERLEREWRMIDPERNSRTVTAAEEHKLLPLRRVRINRFDEVQKAPKD